MQFLAQLFLDDLARHGTGAASANVLSIFMCQNDPGLCDEWDPAFGGNTALLFPLDGLAPAAVPAEGVTALPEVSGVDYVVVEGTGYEEARGQWSTTTGRSRRHVLGQLGGAPAWLQGDETPSCSSCSRPMDFVAQLEEGHHGRTAMNFGGGSAYAFTCVSCARGAFLWQS